MQVSEFIEALERNKEAVLRIILPSGEAVPQHFHVTEVGRVEKDFIDCGGARRKVVSCVLQAWTADDFDHRLKAGKLAKIMKLAEETLGSGSLPMELEYGAEVISLYSIKGVALSEGTLQLELAGKQTACLAMDKCLVVLPDDRGTGCC